VNLTKEGALDRSRHRQMGGILRKAQVGDILERHCGKMRNDEDFSLREVPDMGGRWLDLGGKE